MARQTRAQRRARREAQQGGQQQAGITQRARQRQQQIRPGQQPAKSQTGAQRRERRSSFFAESWGELKKVEWPTQSQVIQATIVVLIACVVVGIYLWLNDQVWQAVVKKILGQ